MVVELACISLEHSIQLPVSVISRIVWGFRISFYTALVKEFVLLAITALSLDEQYTFTCTIHTVSCIHMCVSYLLQCECLFKQHEV